MHKNTLLKLGLVVAILLTIFILRQSSLGDVLTLAYAQSQLQVLLDSAMQRPLVTVSTFILVYIVTAALALPGATILTLISGALFGPIGGTLATNVGATIGATLSFIAARFLFGNSLQVRYASQLERLNMELDAHGTSYLFTLRLVPLFPFFVVNVLAGLTRVPLRTFVWTTSVGIIPGSFVYAFAGREFSTITSVQDIFSGSVLIAFTLLGLLALLPRLLKALDTHGVESPEKVILVDAVHTFVLAGEGINEDMHELLETYDNRKIILTGANDEQMKEFGLDKVPYELFTLKHDPEKTDPQYYTRILEHFDLCADDVVYFEHNTEAVESARSVGITTHHYDREARDLDALTVFLKEHLN